MSTGDDSHALRGAIDAAALFQFQKTFEELEPLAAGELDDPIDPRVLYLCLQDGIGDAETATITVRWSTHGDYNIHYTDDERDARWDVHAPSGDPHFHPPPDASSVDEDIEESCITVSEIDLVARAIHKLWRSAYDDGSVERLNTAENPP